MTAVEWLFEQFNNNNAKFINWSQEYFEQAKLMEKQQIIDAYSELCLWDSKEDAEQYYNEKFNK